MATNGSVGITQVGYFDCAGGGQVVVDAKDEELKLEYIGP